MNVLTQFARAISLIGMVSIMFGFWGAEAIAQQVDPSKQAGAKIQPDNFYPRVKLETSMGDIVIELDRKRAPLTVNNFLNYVARKEYDNTLFHRVVPDYIVQGGGYTPEFEPKEEGEPVFNESGNGLKNTWYSIAMARKDDPHSAIRQFFFNVDENENLDPGRNWGYTVFGAVVEGTEVVDAMGQVETQYKPLIRFQDVPVEPIILKTASILPELSFD
uniref:peptidylprolyl isomerase n=1 Tax=Ningiella ruwaisensis TaxID=2364274 RepID=UPI001F4F579E|nr:peptidylprolyl isomerase [Ningiella ruwaisensis]